MFIKGIMLPFILVVCFGAYFVAMTKPFNLRGVVVIVSLVVSLLVFAFGAGFVRAAGGLGILASLFGLYFVRGKK